MSFVGRNGFLWRQLSHTLYPSTTIRTIVEFNQAPTGFNVRKKPSHATRAPHDTIGTAGRVLPSEVAFMAGSTFVRNIRTFCSSILNVNDHYISGQSGTPPSFFNTLPHFETQSNTPHRRTYKAAEFRAKFPQATTTRHITVYRYEGVSTSQAPPWADFPWSTSPRLE